MKEKAPYRMARTLARAPVLPNDTTLDERAAVARVAAFPVTDYFGIV
jgi:hypothetical protein